MWRCVDCETEFAEPAMDREKHGWDYPPYEMWLCCPVCGSTDLEELYLCGICGEYLPYHKMSGNDEGVCDDCRNRTCCKWQKIKEETAATNLSLAEIRVLKEDEEF